MARVPDFRLQEDVRSFGQAVTDAVFILINGCRIDHFIANIDGRPHSFCGFVIIDLIRTEADLRKLAAIVQGEHGIVCHEISLCSVNGRAQQSFRGLTGNPWPPRSRTAFEAGFRFSIPSLGRVLSKDLVDPLAGEKA